MPGTIPAARKQIIDAIARRARQLRRDQKTTPLPLAEFVQRYDFKELARAELAALEKAFAAHAQNRAAAKRT